MLAVNANIPDLQPEDCLELFEYLDDYLVFVKNTKGQFYYLNRACREYFGVPDIKDIIGKTDLDMSHAKFSRDYLRIDRQVLRTGMPSLDHLELVMDPRGAVRWHLTTKLPIKNKAGKVIGIMGYSRPLSAAQHQKKFSQTFSKMLEWIDQNIRSPIRVVQLANIAGLSLSTFERNFHKRFHMSPKQYTRNIRIASVCREMLETDESVTKIAYDYGYCDQSHLCKDFRRVMGLSPNIYRKRNQKAGSAR